MGRRHIEVSNHLGKLILDAVTERNDPALEQLVRSALGEYRIIKRADQTAMRAEGGGTDLNDRRAARAGFRPITDDDYVSDEDEYAHRQETWRKIFRRLAGKDVRALGWARGPDEVFEFIARWQISRIDGKGEMIDTSMHMRRFTIGRDPLTSDPIETIRDLAAPAEQVKLIEAEARAHRKIATRSRLDTYPETLAAHLLREQGFSYDKIALLIWPDAFELLGDAEERRDACVFAELEDAEAEYRSIKTNCEALTDRAKARVRAARKLIAQYGKDGRNNPT